MQNTKTQHTLDICTTAQFSDMAFLTLLCVYPEDGDDDMGDDSVGTVVAVESREEQCTVSTGILEPGYCG